MTTLLRPEPLTKEAFEPFGDVLEVNPSNEIFGINYGLTNRHPHARWRLFCTPVSKQKQNNHHASQSKQACHGTTAAKLSHTAFKHKPTFCQLDF